MPIPLRVRDAADCCQLCELLPALRKSEKGPRRSSNQGPPAAASCSPPSTPGGRSPSIGVLSAGDFWATFDQCSYFEDENSIFEESLNINYTSVHHKYSAELLEWFMLQKFHLKQLFTKEEMWKFTTWENTDEFAETFKSACEDMEAIFSVEVREVDYPSLSYTLISKLTLPNNGRIRPGRGYPKTGLLMKVLAVILLNGHCVAEEILWSVLKTMKVYPGKKHIMFGEPKLPAMSSCGAPKPMPRPARRKS
ncbi:Melanoma-associated antigen B5 [Heterocephalus glaber]|uniref:Melanoma-associated antigen B5 n=1 Tax=Heterocephalus glaber TaxID=10181 RepID=G5BTP6_HETGA|nr:Melanoma-associated antigen B5 [Heterocephalus glaber]